MLVHVSIRGIHLCVLVARNAHAALGPSFKSWPWGDRLAVSAIAIAGLNVDPYCIRVSFDWNGAIWDQI